MAIVATTPASASLADVSPLLAGASGGGAVGLRGAGALGSGLRAGITLVDDAERSAVEIQEAREEAERAARETAQESARETDRAQQRITDNNTANDLSGAEGQDQPANDGGVREAVSAAVAAGQTGQPSDRGAFIDVSV